LLCTFLLGIMLCTNAQDLHFTQFFRLPGQLNPAIQGNALYQLQAAIDYRQQWNSLGAPYTTLAGDVAYRFNRGFDHFSSTFTWSTDQSGYARLQMNRLHAGLAYQHQWEHWYISFGTQLGFLQAKTHEATFPKQYNNTSGFFDLSLNNGEYLYSNASTALDLNSGIAVNFDAGQIKILLAYGLYHINQPAISMTQTGIDGKYPLRQQIFAMAAIPLPNITFNPMLFYSRQSKAEEYIIGATADYRLPVAGELPITLSPGLFWRSNVSFYTSFFSTDALMIYTGLLYRWFDLGLSYDLNVSGLRKVSHYRGGFELSLAYRYKSLHEYKQITVPCIRY